MVSFNLDPTILRSKTASKLVRMLVMCTFHMEDNSDTIKLKSDIRKIKRMREQEITKPSSKKRSKTQNGS